MRRRLARRRMLEKKCQDACLYCFHDGFPSRAIEAHDGHLRHPHGKCAAPQPHRALLAKFPSRQCDPCQTSHYADDAPAACLARWKKRHALLSPRAVEVLRLMVERADDPDGEGELVGEKGTWWIGTERTSWGVAKQLLRLCLVRDVSDTHSLLRYEADPEEARRVLDDPSYVPEIVRLTRR